MMRFERTLDALTRPYLKFPLSGHDFRVDTRDLDAGEQTSLVVCLNDISAIDLASTHTAIVRSLWSRETTLRPAIRPTIKTQEGIFLLETKPGFLACIGFHEPSSFVAIVELVGGAIMVPCFTQDQDVLASTERIGVDRYRTEVNIRVVARGLAARGAVEVPF